MTPEKRVKPPVTLDDPDPGGMSKNERIKLESEGLFYVSDGKQEPHSFAEEVDQLTAGERPTLSNEAKEISKFFGIYKQQTRGERGRKTDDYFFMVRIACPAGGELDARQWLALDRAADDFADGTIRITSRQGVQYHHVYGPKLARLVRHLNRSYRERATLGACGDVNRNVMVSPIDGLDGYEPRGRELGHDIAQELVPQSSAYFQIFLTDDEGRRVAPVNPDEPIYGKHYLPRKFKIGIAHPRDNSVDILTQDVGLLPVTTNGSCDGSVFDVYTGGGLGLTHNNPVTAALLGLYLGRVRRAQLIDLIRGIVVLQRQNGDRRDRRQARWKYTVRRLGLDAVRSELETRFGIEIDSVTPLPLPSMQLHLGWHEQRGAGGYYGLSVENGRLRPELRGAIREAVESLGLSVRFTAQQDLLLCNVAERSALEGILAKHGVKPPESISQVRRNSMACPAKPTCGLAMTDAENILPIYIDALEAAGLGDVDAVIRMTGCPNNCARPPTAEIGIYGYGKNDHVILVGGSRGNTRLARVLYSRVPGANMIPLLVGLFRAIQEKKPEGVSVGDFLHGTSSDTLLGWIGIDDGAA